MTLFLLVLAIACLSAGVAVLLVTRAGETLDLLPGDVAATPDPVAPSTSRPKITVRHEAPQRPRGYGRTVTPCGHSGNYMRVWTSGGRQMLCTHCGAVWDPASRNVLEIASDGFVQFPRGPKISGHEWTLPFGGYPE